MTPAQYDAWYKETQCKRQKRYRDHCKKIGKPLAANMSINQRKAWRAK